eukprot:m.1166331 g.1166331  ORF g.1166331 m.1166331 type:complete len:258 (-) comp24505_c0_seq23:1659-2432(-)
MDSSNPQNNSGKPEKGLVDETTASRVLIKGLPPGTFNDDTIAAEFDGILQGFGSVLSISKHEDLGAVKVEYKDIADASAAAAGIKHFDFIGHILDAVTADSTAVKDSAPQMDHLCVPELEKQWLISPPPSPPIGWEPIKEDPPVVNMELVHALQGMDPTQPHELHPPDTVRGLPSIHVMLAEEEDVDPEGDADVAMSPDVDNVIPHTSMPPPWASDAVHGAPWQTRAPGVSLQHHAKTSRPALRPDPPPAANTQHST